jgi:hypothetical protein
MAGVMGHGLAVNRIRERKQAERQAAASRASGSTITLDSDEAGARVPLEIEIRRRFGGSWGFLARMAYAIPVEDVTTMDTRTPWFVARLVETTRRRSGHLGLALGGWAEGEFAPGWRAGVSAAAGGVYGWRTVISELEWWWTPAGPPDLDRSGVAWGGWGVLGDLAVGASRDLAGPLRIFVEGGFRAAWVPRMTAVVAYRDRDGDGLLDAERVVDRERGKAATRYDFGAWRAAIGVRIAP